MALLNLEKDEEKVRPCICGREKRKTLYKTPELSPDRLNVVLGSIVIAVIEIGFPIFLLLSDASILIPFVALPLPMLILVLGIYRIFRGHSAGCSIRWAYLTFAGLGRFLSF
jgi:hypothetical protein